MITWKVLVDMLVDAGWRRAGPRQRGDTRFLSFSHPADARLVYRIDVSILSKRADPVGMGAVANILHRCCSAPLEELPLVMTELHEPLSVVIPDAFIEAYKYMAMGVAAARLEGRLL